MPLAIDRYRERAELMLEQLEREYYLHLAGHKQELELEPIYDRYADLCTQDAVEALRDSMRSSPGDDGTEQRRRGYLLQFAVDGYLGLETRGETAELARLEASLEVQAGERPVPYRMVPVEQANEEDPQRRQELESARNELLDERLNPLHLEMLERSHTLVDELGWASYADAYAELRGIDLTQLAGQAAMFLERTEASYQAICDPELERHAATRLEIARRSDLPRFFRAATLDGPFEAAKLVPSFAETLSAIGVDLASQDNVTLDTESRPSKSPRAFCSTPRVPGEVYLVVQPIGGREDFAALFHEGGHSEHYATTDPALPFEFRQLGDNSVTESYAFLLEHVTEDAGWLRSRLGAEDPEPMVRHARAVKLLMLRRHAAKLVYELELHGPGLEIDRMRGRYTELLENATRVRWTPESWLSDVDGGFYVACYLRAWALEARWRTHLRDRFGSEWFEQPQAGEWLCALWRDGQRLRADELLAEHLGEQLDLAALAGEFA